MNHGNIQKHADVVASYYKEGKSIKQIAVILGIGASSVGRLLEKNNVIRRGPHIEGLDDANIITLYQQGLSSYKIGEILGCNYGTVLFRLHKLGYKVRKRGTHTNIPLESQIIINPDNGCWEWSGKLNTKGYGIINVNGKPKLAHRHSYSLYKENPVGLLVCHHCDNPKCCNPDHLFLGTYKDNSQDMMAKGRHRTGPNRIKKNNIKLPEESQTATP